MEMKKLVILSGPSCVGKGPLLAALRKYHPEIEFAEPVFCHSRKPRLKRATGQYETHGVDYYFFPYSMIDGLDRTRFIVGPLRSDIQALDMSQVLELIDSHGLVITEAYITFIDPLKEWLARHGPADIEVRTVFLSPMSDSEITAAAAASGKTREQVVYENQLAKITARGEDPPGKTEERARNAWAEMQYAHRYTDHIVCRAGEDDTGEWGEPLGPEAARVLGEFLAVIEG